MNIIWQKPDGTLAVTHLHGVADADEYAQHLIESGGAPDDWMPIRYNVELPDAPIELLTLDASGKIVIDDARLAEIERSEYRRQRAAAYPSLVEQLDLIYHGGLDAWRTQINTIKTRYPKPVSS